MCSTAQDRLDVMAGHLRRSPLPSGSLWRIKAFNISISYLVSLCLRTLMVSTSLDQPATALEFVYRLCCVMDTLSASFPETSFIVLSALVKRTSLTE